MNKFFVLILLLVVNSKNFVQAQDPEICSTQDGSPCVKLNDLLAPCDTKFGPPPSNVSSLEYSVDNSATASCMCNQDAYDTLSSCISTCFSNENPNIKTANFEDYQRSCRNFGFIFGPPIKDQSLSDKNDTAGTAKKVLIGIFTSISFLIVLGLLIWYWNSKRSRAPKQNAKPQSFDDVSIHEQMTVHHPAPGSGTPVSSLPNADYNPTSHTGLFPPPGTVQNPHQQQHQQQHHHPQQHHPQHHHQQQQHQYQQQQQQYNRPPPPPQQYSPSSQPYSGGAPYHNGPRYNNSSPPPASQQGYFPPQPQQTPYQQPFQPPYPRPPPNRVPYQQPHHSRTNSPGIDPSYPRNSPPPPQNYYNPNNFYGGGGGY
ncbi:unnamed protein product [Rhizophagus irregularis]|nr:unnamed protein product [Rhizophagus irregularis]CAB5363536.1 unnamed protein product [Rhizophagus irregularis]